MNVHVGSPIGAYLVYGHPAGRAIMKDRDCVIRPDRWKDAFLDNLSQVLLACNKSEKTDRLGLYSKPVVALEGHHFQASWGSWGNILTELSVRCWRRNNRQQQQQDNPWN